MDSTYLYLKVQVLKNGAVFAAAEDISTSNSFISSLFEVCEVYLNDRLISSKNNYGYASYLTQHLSYDSQYKKDILLSGLYTEDSNLGTISDLNPGYKQVSCGYIFLLLLYTSFFTEKILH